MASKIYFIRHGITEGNKNRWFYGAADLPLAEEGREQLLHLKEQGVYPVLPDNAQYLTSCLKRTEETLRLLYGDVPHTKIPELNEMDFGEYECKDFEELKEDPVFLEWGYDTTGDAVLPGGESRNRFNSRVIEGAKEVVALHRLKELSVRHNGRDAVTMVVCHGGVISAVMQYFFPGEKRTMWDWIPEPGSGYELEMKDGEPASARVIGKAGDGLIDTINDFEEQNGRGPIE